ncbi:DUF4307 domain-containing protein [Actinopolyspora mortivallis]|uniref:DUF4307 domain-containing protein n=1 Tax=Actinopolyspora mortivallis TaxID=33906 RepID=UPI001B7F9D49|nr:DUF4307 domain-containing protein [Actinopolyspora mortivallis]
MTNSPETIRRAPEGRYGSRGGAQRRWPVRLSAGLVLLAGVLVAVIAYRNLGSAPIQGKASSFEVGQDSVRITLEVRRDDPAKAAECVVRARARSGREVGRGEVYIPPGQPTTYHRTELTTSAPPVTGEVFGCSYEIPSYLESRGRPSG